MTSISKNVHIDELDEIIGDKLEKAMFQIDLKKFLWLKKLKTLCSEHMLLVMLTEKKFGGYFTRKSCKKSIKKSLEFKK